MDRDDEYTRSNQEETRQDPQMEEDTSMQAQGEGGRQEYGKERAGMGAGGDPQGYQSAGGGHSMEGKGEIEGTEGGTGGEALEAEGEGGPEMEAAEGGSMEEEKTVTSEHEGGSAAQLQQYLRGVDYPADKQDMIDAARSNSAPDDFISFMNRLPDKTYNRPMDVEQEFNKIK